MYYTCLNYLNAKKKYNCFPDAQILNSVIIQTKWSCTVNLLFYLVSLFYQSERLLKQCTTIMQGVFKKKNEYNKSYSLLNILQ